MPIACECIYTVLAAQEFVQECGSERLMREWVVIAGPYILPDEIDLLKGAVSPLEKDSIEFRVVSENKWGNVVNLYRRKPKPRFPFA